MDKLREDYQEALDNLALLGLIDMLLYWQLSDIKPSYELVEILRDILRGRIAPEIAQTFIRRIINSR